MKITQHNQLLSAITCVGLTSKPNDASLRIFVDEIHMALHRRGVSLLIDEVSAQALGAEGTPFDTMCARSDFLISLGGAVH